MRKLVDSKGSRVGGHINRANLAVGIGCFLLSLDLASANNFTSLCVDRTAVERVYYEHRLGNRPPFEQVLPRETIERLVRNDLRKEAALKQAYGVEITPAMLEAEVQRINTTTRAPDILAELKAVLGHDPQRFARIVARPIVVERLLRDKFDNDNNLHASQRQQMEAMRNELLAAKEGDNRLGILKRVREGSFTEMTWQLTARPAEDQSTKVTAAPTATEIIATAGQYRVEAAAQLAQVLPSAATEAKERKSYFEDLPGDLQNVLRVQLREPGDVSAVVEMPGGFALYLLERKTADTMTVAVLSIHKRSYEDWLAEQKE